MRGQEGVSLDTYSVYTSQASCIRVTCTSQLYNYMLRFHLTMPPPFIRIVPNPSHTQASIKPHKTLIRKKIKGERASYLRTERRVYIYTSLVGRRLFICVDSKATAYQTYY